MNKKRVRIESSFDGDTTSYFVFVDGERKGAHWTFESAKEEAEQWILKLSKEEENMKTLGTQVQVIDFEFDGVRYTNTRPGYYYKKENGKQVRIGKAEWDAAWEQSGEAEKKEREEKQAKADKEVEKKFNKPRRSKDIAYEGNGVTLTAKQVKFIKLMPEDDFYERGLESALWIDVFCDTISGDFSPMAVGAMVSTLREKQILVVGMQKVNGKNAKYMAFTELGQQVAKELGLN